MRENGIIRIVRPFVSFFLFFASCAGEPPGGPPRRPLHDFRGIIHCHSLYSHDSKGTYEEILAAAKAARVDFVCMTDHPPKGDAGKSLREGWTGLHDGVLFIQGAEYSDQILALGIRDAIQFKDRRGTIRAIHEQGGVAIACHPEEIKDWSEYEEADGMEIYNVHAALKKHQLDPSFMARAIKQVKEDPERLFEMLHDLDEEVLKVWDGINRKRRFTGIAGNDAHQNVSPFGIPLDPYPRAFRHVATHVWAEELTQEAVLRAIREGRCYVEFRMATEGPAAREKLFWVEASPGLLVARLPLWMSVRKVTLYRDGREVDVVEVGSEYKREIRDPGSYRIAFAQDPGPPLILSNAFRFPP